VACPLWILESIMITSEKLHEPRTSASLFRKVPLGPMTCGDQWHRRRSQTIARLSPFSFLLISSGGRPHRYPLHKTMQVVGTLCRLRIRTAFLRDPSISGKRTCKYCLCSVIIDMVVGAYKRIFGGNLRTQVLQPDRVLEVHRIVVRYISLGL
jgi:hypothetical protein